MRLGPRLRRYWREKNLPVLLSIPLVIILALVGDWGGLMAIAFVAALAWMDTP